MGFRIRDNMIHLGFKDQNTGKESNGSKNNTEAQDAQEV